MHISFKYIFFPDTQTHVKQCKPSGAKVTNRVNTHYSISTAYLLLKPDTVLLLKGGNKQRYHMDVHSARFIMAEI